MKQEIFMPDGHLIFSTTDKNLMYDERIIKSMVKNGYTVKVDGRKVRKSKDAS